MKIIIIPGSAYHFGLGLRGDGAFASHYPLSFRPANRTVTLAGESLELADGLDAPFDLEVILKDDIIDVCVGGERRGETLFFFAHGGDVTFDAIRIESV